VPVVDPRRSRLPAFVLALGLLCSGAAHIQAATHGHLDDGFEYILFDPDKDHGSTFMTSMRAWDDVNERFEGEKNPVFWFAVDGREWIVRDPSTVAKAAAILEPVRELGLKQGKLGARQGRYGAQQGKLGAEQGRLGARQGALAGRLAALSARHAVRGRESASARAERRRIEAEMEELGEEMEALDRRQEPLGDVQAKLGAEQAELGRRQASASKRAGSELRRLAERAREDGTAIRAD
jgi:bla regulator protein BlaR1